MPVRKLSPDDASWAAELMERRRRTYERFSPVFWRPAKGVTGLHARFLHRLIASEANVALRTDHGFIIGQPRAAECFVDDFAVDEEGTWAQDGAALLLAASARLAAADNRRGAGGAGAGAGADSEEADGAGTAGAGTAGAETEGGESAKGAQGPRVMRVVSAHADQAKTSMLSSLSLRLAEQWWVRELQPAEPTAAPGRTEGTGFSGIFGPAPPVYDPGGLVLLADRVADDADIAVIEREAAAMGAVLVIVPAVPGSARGAALGQRDWSVASDWYLGRPA